MQQKIKRLDTWIYYALCGLSLSLFTTVAGSSIFLGISIFLFFIRVYLRRDDLWEPFGKYRQFVYAYGLFVLAMLLSAFFSGDIRKGIGLVISRQGYYVMPCVIVMAIVRERFKLIMLAKLALVSLLANNLCLFVKAWKIYGVQTIRIEGLVGFMALAAVFSVAIPLLYLGTAYFKGQWHWICFVSGSSCILANLFTGTRSGWLVSAAVLFLIAALYTKNKRKLLAGMLVMAIGVAGIVVVSPTLSARVRTISSPSDDASVMERFIIWKSAANIWKDYPVLGIGVGQYQNAYQTQYCLPDSLDYKLSPEARHNHPHNNLMLILSEAGIVGGTAYLVFLCLLLWFSFRGWWRTKNVLYLVLLSILLGTQLQGLMDTNIKMTVVCKMYWFFIGITLQMIGIDCAWNFAGEKAITHRKDE